jgi:hypothetical protein
MKRRKKGTVAGVISRVEFSRLFLGSVARLVSMATATTAAPSGLRYAPLGWAGATGVGVSTCAAGAEAPSEGVIWFCSRLKAIVVRCSVDASSGRRFLFVAT